MTDIGRHTLWASPNTLWKLEQTRYATGYRKTFLTRKAGSVSGPNSNYTRYPVRRIGNTISINGPSSIPAYVLAALRDRADIIPE